MTVKELGCAGWRRVVVRVALMVVPGAALAQDTVEIPYVAQERCAEILDDLWMQDEVPAEELTFVTQVCHASRLVDYRARTLEDQTPVDAGQTRSLPKSGSVEGVDGTELDRQIDIAAKRSEDSWDDLAQGDPKAAYDLLKRLIGDQGGGT
jgi:hypothetical protein